MDRPRIRGARVGTEPTVDGGQSRRGAGGVALPSRKQGGSTPSRLALGGVPHRGVVAGQSANVGHGSRFIELQIGWASSREAACKKEID